MAISPTQLSLKKIREEGYVVVQVVEYWNAFARRRIDLYGFIDILAIKNGHVLAVQTTTVGNMGARIKKIANHENVGEVRKANWTIHVHGWHKPGGKWECIVKDVS
jgi:hypothetical protein